MLKHTILSSFTAPDIVTSIYIFSTSLEVERFSQMSKSGTEERGKMNTQITQTIKEEILKWPGITTEPNRFGGIEFLVNKKEMGHLHGEKLTDLPFPVEIRKELVASGRALQHHIYPESGWVHYWIRNSDDIPAGPGAI